jgi:hypothetical protein
MTTVYEAGRTEGTELRRQILAEIDPDADEQRWYHCPGCRWPCINPIGSEPERLGLCVDCVVEEHQRCGTLDS